MADGDIDLYADDLEQDFAQDEFAGDGLDLYDDVIAATDRVSMSEKSDRTDRDRDNRSPTDEANENSSYNQLGNNIHPNQVGRRHQLYIGNLTWWTTDKDIQEAIVNLGITDFIEVKFFENRANGQSKGFSVVSLGSDQSTQICMDRLPKTELHGQNPVVTYPSKHALNQFESQCKTRPPPSPQHNQNQRPHNSHPHTPMSPQHHSQHQQHPQHMQQNHGHRGMMMGPPQYDGPRQGQRMPPPGMGQPGPGGPPQGPPRMHGPPMGPGPGPHHQMQGHPNQGPPPPGYQQGPWNGPRPNGPQRGPNGPGGPGQQGMPVPGPGQRPPPGMVNEFQFHGGPPGPMNQGPPRGPPGHPGPPGELRGAPPRGAEWNRPPGMMPGPGGMPPGHGMPPQGPPGPPGGPAPHVNPAFFQQGPSHQGPPGPPHGPTHGPAPHNYGPPAQTPYGAPGPEHRPEAHSNLTELEFEEIMGRNRTVSSSAIARAVSDAAAGEYASAIETLVTAISLIKQSKVAGDDRCKILISSLQDTLRGIETKSYGSARRDRSRSRDRDRNHRRRRERSRSRDREYRDRSRERDRDRDREREREREKERYYNETYPRERSRSRERERDREREYRERSREESYSQVLLLLCSNCSSL
ncbi:cleavage and polyadenylation specificity factor subunit 6-like isoform X2 [Leptopilina boulardi]|uniref:cleavage and polyadenylation specificity factor subunit 6-like isoform X2 n=1 Tax=Leptopilina boulardi TaxID=63433 RepID=UPI0021F5A109|nr:cleavage and polyadenylation specificity factor subunit 6-like isoform X2 [Leptopilina boulardi]